MAEQFSVERRKLMRFLGAKVVLTPQAQRGMGMVNKAIELAKTHGWFLTRQFENEANPDYPLPHDRARDRRGLQGREARLLGDGLRHRRHAEGRRARAGQGDARHQDHRVRARGRAAPGQRHRAGAQSPTVRRPPAHPAFKPHPMQGWTPDFIPKITGDAVAMKVIHKLIPIPGAEAHPHEQRAGHQGRYLRRHHVGRDVRRRAAVAAEAPKGATILCMLPDTGERYLSTPLFASIPADMTEEESTSPVDPDRPVSAGVVSGPNGGCPNGGPAPLGLTGNLSPGLRLDRLSR